MKYKDKGSGHFPFLHYLWAPYQHQARIKDLSLGSVGCEAPNARRNEARKGQRNETPKTLRRVGSGEGFPLPSGGGGGRGCAPPQDIVVKFMLNSHIYHHFVRITTT